ncbi:MAG: 50S ribosomal protein L1 [Rickettsiaceae bacterium]
MNSNSKNLRDRKYSKNASKAKQLFDPVKSYDLLSAIDQVKSMSYAKFDETLEIAMNLGVDPKHSDQVVRGVVLLPCGTGKTTKVGVICKEDRIQEALDVGADFAGESIIDEIKSGNINCDTYISTPDMMVKIGSVAKILGPKGLMPNPKLGTVTTDIKTAVNNAKSGQVEFRTKDAGVVHAGLGKLSFNSDDLLKNISSFISGVVAAKPSTAKGAYVKSVFISSTMSPSVKVDLSSLELVN